MTKARTLADFISDGSPLADGTISVSEVSGAAPLESPTFTGTITSTGDIALGDLDELILGSDKMRLYYDSNNNYTVLDSNGTQGFRFMGTNGLSVEIDGSAVTSFGLNGVTISPNGTEKLQVYSGGSIFSGNLRVNDDIKLGFGQFGTDLEIYHDTASTTNKLVGDLTQTGRLTTDAADLAAIAKSITDTAVDVFVYDTSKDSDGGAWRKRTQGTSWYNETLNTATRGARREFPAVAVIVAESNQVTIYDGDDPDLPMWMVFNGVGSRGGQTAYYVSGGTLTGLSALNGQLSVSHYGTVIINMVADSGIYVGSASDNNKGTFTKPIIERNAVQGYTSPVLIAVQEAHNDVAMTVLPNAPIDPATGLPVPTIAVATGGGVSVIKDDGTVVSLTTSNNTAETVSWLSNNHLAAETVGYPYVFTVSSLPKTVSGYVSSEAPSSDLWHHFSITEYANTYNYVLTGTNGTYRNETVGEYLGSYCDAGFALVDENFENYQNGSSVHVTSTYNTGWMNGDIKLATLSDTDDTDVTGGSLLTGQKSTYDVDTSTPGWNTQANATVSHSSGNGNGGGNAVSVTSSGGSNIYGSLDTGLSLTSGKQYILQFDIRNSSGTAASVINASQNAYHSGTQYGNILTSSDNLSTTYQTVYFTFTATTANLNLNVYAGTGNNVAVYLDNIQVHEAEEDRSVNGNGLQVFGTVTKNPVATGADLVAYSGFSGSNYLQQPYNSDLDFGTSAWSVTCWFKIASGANTAVMLSWRNSGGAAPYWQIYQTNTAMNFDASDGSGYAGLSTSTTYRDDHWHMLTFLARGPSLREAYVDGKFVGSSTTTVGTGFTGGSDHEFKVGQHYDGAYSYTGSVALVRISATAPSPEQIKKIYEDEKVLFQENAQATLYGSSDAVTALAYDDSTELLHVGTSAGRSVFQGLRRVDNTTDAVGAAISASNGLVAED